MHWVADVFRGIQVHIRIEVYKQNLLNTVLVPSLRSSN